MKYMIGYQLQESGKLIEEIQKHRAQVHEVYFAWDTMPSGRGGTVSHSRLLPYEAVGLQLEQLSWLAQQKIATNLLLNANCYGKDSLSRRFLMQTGDLIADFQEKLGVRSVTTTSPVLAHFIKENFEDVEVRASVNMEIGTVEAMEYLAEDFDSYYYKRELNRDIRQVRRLKQWCDQNGKKLFMLANSGCLNYCSARQFHDNLVAHENEIAQMDNGAKFVSQCSRFVAKKANQARILQHLNCVRPEEMSLFEPYVEAAKLATRVSPRPENIVRAYMAGNYTGNLLELLEPSHAGAFYPNILDNAALPENYCEHVAFCDKNCEQCNYCTEAYQKASVQLNDGGIFDVNKCNDQRGGTGSRC